VAAVAAGKARSAATVVDDSRVPVGAAPGR